jgi:hypothetical protein
MDVNRSQLGLYICFPRLNRFLVYAGNPVLFKRQGDAVPVYGAGFRQIIGENNANVVPFGHPDFRPGDLPVESPCRHDLSFSVFPPNRFGGQVEFFDVSFHDIGKRLYFIFYISQPEILQCRYPHQATQRFGIHGLSGSRIFFLKYILKLHEEIDSGAC